MNCFWIGGIIMSEENKLDWFKITAEQLTTMEVTKEYVESQLYAAVELKSCKLKILLARCYELMVVARTDEVCNWDSDFEQLLLEEIK